MSLNDGEQDDDDEEEEGDVEQDAPDLQGGSSSILHVCNSSQLKITMTVMEVQYLVGVAVRGLDLVADAAARPHALVQVEHEALQDKREACQLNLSPGCVSGKWRLHGFRRHREHSESAHEGHKKRPLLVTHCEHVVALLVDLFLLLGDIELPEEVEGDDGVDVDDDGEQPHGEHELKKVQNYCCSYSYINPIRKDQGKLYLTDMDEIISYLLAVVRDGLEDNAEGGDADGDVDEVGREEEVVVVAEDGEDKVPQQVQEGLQGKEGV